MEMLGLRTRVGGRHDVPHERTQRLALFRAAALRGRSGAGRWRRIATIVRDGVVVQHAVAWARTESAVALVVATEGPFAAHERAHDRIGHVVTAVLAVGIATHHEKEGGSMRDDDVTNMPGLDHAAVGAIFDGEREAQKIGYAGKKPRGLVFTDTPFFRSL